jgi:ADP-ribosyl-[dinitrogen reductase] hydrolase
MEEDRVEATLQDRARGCAVGAAVGDALGMPLEFDPPRPESYMVREMGVGRLPPGTFTDDTEMALALAESLLRSCPIEPEDLAPRFVDWYGAGPYDIGLHTRSVLARVATGTPWDLAVEAQQAENPDSAGNGSLMRAWPVALAHWDDLHALLADSRLQSRVTHPHPECEAGCAFANAAIYFLMQGAEKAEAIAEAVRAANVPEALQATIEAAPLRSRRQLANSGWVRHTLESAVWGLMTTDSFEEAAIQVVNLGRDADTAGAVVGALAGTAYGLAGIPDRWQAALRGQWPIRTGPVWRTPDLITLADRLLGVECLTGGDLVE